MVVFSLFFEIAALRSLFCTAWACASLGDKGNLHKGRNVASMASISGWLGLVGVQHAHRCWPPPRQSHQTNPSALFTTTTPPAVEACKRTKQTPRSGRRLPPCYDTMAPLPPDAPPPGDDPAGSYSREASNRGRTSGRALIQGRRREKTARSLPRARRIAQASREGRQRGFVVSDIEPSLRDPLPAQVGCNKRIHSD